MKHYKSPTVRELLINILKNDKIKEAYIKFAEKLLYQYTDYKFARYTTGADIFFSVIDKIFEGNYTWNPEKIPLKKFIYYRIRTEVFDLAKKERKWKPVSINLYSDLCQDENDDNISNLPLPHNMIFEETQIKIYPVDPEIVRNAACKIFPRSTVECRVFKGIYNNIKTENLIEKLGITVAEFYKIRKRIIRELQKWYADRKKIIAMVLNLIIHINIIMEVLDVYSIS